VSETEVDTTDILILLRKTTHRQRDSRHTDWYLDFASSVTAQVECCKSSCFDSAQRC